MAFRKVCGKLCIVRFRKNFFCSLVLNTIAINHMQKATYCVLSLRYHDDINLKIEI